MVISKLKQQTRQYYITRTDNGQHTKDGQIQVILQGFVSVVDMCLLFRNPTLKHRLSGRYRQNLDPPLKLRTSGVGHTHYDLAAERSKVKLSAQLEVIRFPYPLIDE